MKLQKDLTVVLATALLTALLAWPVLTPALSVAEEQAEAEVAELDFRALQIKNMVGPNVPLWVEGLVFSVELDKESYKAGETPRLTLVARNTKKDKACAKVTVRMNSQEPRDPMSRAMFFPEQVLAKELAVEVPAGETMRIAVECDHAVAAGKVLTLALQSGETYSPAGGFAVAAPTTAKIETQVAQR